MLSVGNLDEGDLVLGAQSDNELLVGLLLAGLVENTHVGLASVESLGGFTETTGETIVHESELENTLEGVENAHLSLRPSVSGDFDFGRLGDGGGGLFYIRL